MTAAEGKGPNRNLGFQGEVQSIGRRKYCEMLYQFPTTDTVKILVVSLAYIFLSFEKG